MADDSGRSPEKMRELTSRGGLIGAYRLDRKGGGADIDWDAIESDPLGDQVDGDLWVHLDRTGTHAKQWLTGAARVPASAARAMLSDDPRPRFTRFPASDATPEGVLFVLRGMNFNEGAATEDMVSVRLWIDEHRVITTRRRKVLAIDDHRQALLRGSGPRESEDVFLGINESLLERMEPVLAAMDAELMRYEDDSRGADVLDAIAGLRRRVAVFRRHLGPQRDAIAQADGAMPAWVSVGTSDAVHDAAIGLARIVDHLDELRERAAVVQDELTLEENRRSSRIGLRLTVIAAIFLPANLVAAVWGMNTGGLPFAEPAWGFWAVMGLLVVLGVGGTWMARGLLR